MYQLSRLMRGNARSFVPIMIGSRKLPSVAGIDGMRKKKIITTPCSVKSLLYMSGDHEVALRRQQLQPDAGGEQPADREEDRDRDEVQHRDPLVVLGQEPRGQAVRRVEIAVAFSVHV